MVLISIDFFSDCKVWLVSRGCQLSKSLLLFGVNSLLLPPHPWQEAAAYCRFVYRNYAPIGNEVKKISCPVKSFRRAITAFMGEVEIRVTMPQPQQQSWHMNLLVSSSTGACNHWRWVCVGNILIAVESDLLCKNLSLILYMLWIYTML